MARMHRFLAMDLGAESGRGIIVTLRDGRATMEEIHRFSNRPVRMRGTLHWDFPFLLAEVLESLRVCAIRGIRPDSVGVDTWGVDFGLLDDRGNLLGNPVHYRDSRTENIHKYSNKLMATEEIFAATGYEPWAISSLFQLLSMQRDNSAILSAARAFLNMPDLLNYFLTGVRTNELSILNTSNLLGTDCQWAEAVIQRCDLQREMFGDLLAPASVVGPLSPEVSRQVGMEEGVPVAASCGHDTSAAVAAVPAEGDDWAFISCGTWSILGSLLAAPIAQPRCLELGFTNEYTIGGWYIARNISGLWPIQELRRKWNTTDDPWDYDRITAEARKTEGGPLVDAADPSLMAPDDMEQALTKLIADAGQAPAQSRGQLVRCVLESLALEYNRRLNALTELNEHCHESLYLVGGGTANKLLCQFTADACGMSIQAGADQCTAMGNALGQALALGILDSPGEIRAVMRNSFEMVTYEPQDQSAWDAKRAKYADLTASG